MNTLELKRNWNNQKGKFRQRLTKLIVNDLTYEEEENEEVFRRLQNKFGKSKEELIKIITMR